MQMESDEPFVGFGRNQLCDSPNAVASLVAIQNIESVVTSDSLGSE